MKERGLVDGTRERAGREITRCEQRAVDSPRSCSWAGQLALPSSRHAFAISRVVGVTLAKRVL